MNTSRRILKNTGFLMISNVISYFLYLWAVMIMANYLGAHDYGIITLGFSFNGIVCILCDLGLGMLTVREVARDHSLTDKYISNTTSMKVVFSIVTVAISFVTAILMGYNTETVTVIGIVSLAYVASSFAFIFFSIFQAHEEMGHQAIIFGLDNVFFILLIFAALHYSLGVLAFALIYVIRNSLIMLYIFSVYAWKYKLPKIEIDLTFWKNSLKQSIPFGIVGVCLTIYFFITTIMLSVMVGETSVGYYNIAFKIIFFFLSLYSVYTVAVFPVMSALFKKSPHALNFTFNRSFKYTLMVSIPLSVAITILAPKLILLCFGSQYTPSILILQILIWVLIFLFLNAIAINFMGSVNRQMTVIKIMGMGLILNIITNTILISNYSYIGASLSTLITEAIVLPIYLFTLFKLGFADRSLMKDVHKILFSSLIMALLLIYLNNINLILLAVLGVIVYILTLYLTRTFDENDKMILKVLKFN
jgi:O-antigen/teichoic acid export membrane protein